MKKSAEILKKEKMTAAVLEAVGDMKIKEIDIPDCKEDEVLVEIKACGVCGSDIGRVFVNGTYHFPTVIGHEFSGKVIYDEKDILTGKRVCVFPLLPCFECENCKAERYAQCSGYDYYGSRRDGAFAEYIAVKRFNIIELPDNVSYEEGAMCEPTSVAQCAVKKLKLNKGDNILITGAGPIGIIAGIWAKYFGAGDVYYIDIDKKKIDLAKEFGFSEYNENAKIDCVVEGTGVGAVLKSCVDAVKPSGKIVLMGNPSREVSLSAKDYQNILRKEITLLGTWNSVYAKDNNNWKDSLKMMSEKKADLLKLITHKIALEDSFEMLKKMRDKEEFYCKVMIVNE